MGISYAQDFQMGKVSVSELEQKFSYFIENIQDKLRILIVAEINQSILPADSYAAVKDFFQKMVNKENENIVLKKVRHE
jgi:uncharacterized protein YfkK (UPF0435 family)